MLAVYTPLRVLLGALCVFFAYYFGRSLVARIEGRIGVASFLRWGLRVVLTALGCVWGALDWISIVALVLALASAGLGSYTQLRPSRSDSRIRITGP
jgi:hypothetical protein